MKRVVVGSIFFLASSASVYKSIVSIEHDWGLFVPVVFALAAMVTLCVSGILFWDAAAVWRDELAKRPKFKRIKEGKVDLDTLTPGFLRTCEIGANAYAFLAILSLAAALVLWKEGLEIWPGVAAIFAVVCLLSYFGCRIILQLFENE